MVVTVLGATRAAAPAQAAGSYTFQKLATLGQPAPHGGNHLYAWEMGDLNNRGDVMSGSFLSTPWDWAEGVFLWRGGTETEIMRSGDPAPNGNTYGGYGYFSTGAMDNYDNVVFTFGTDPTDWTKPLGYDAVVSRYDATTGLLSGVMIPHVTKAPVGGGYFRGATWITDVNDRGETVFNGIIDTPNGPSKPPHQGAGYGLGVYRADRRGRFVNVASPGDRMPLGVLDVARSPTINERGDVAFEAHHAGDPRLCSEDDDTINYCSSAVYVRRATVWQPYSGFPSLGFAPATVIAHVGDPAPGGGTYKLTWGASLNGRGDVLFTGTMDMSGSYWVNGLFLNKDGRNSAVVRAGDQMPGGGHVWNGPNGMYNYESNDFGQIAFAVNLDEDTNGDGLHDSGEYVVGPLGRTTVVARTGTVLPGIGTVAQIQDPLFGTNDTDNGFARINNRGQVLFEVILDTGDAVMVVATPQ